MRIGSTTIGVLVLATSPALVGTLLSGAGCARQEPTHSGSVPDPHWPSKGQVMLTGILRGGIAAIGGETTGWVLEREDGSQLDVDVSAVRKDATAMEGKRVRLAGEMTRKRWVERGERDLMVVAKAEPVQ